MKVLLVFPNYGTNPSFSPALQVLSALLKREGHEVELFHLHEKMGFIRDKKIIQGNLENYGPDVVFFTSTSFEYNSTNEVAGWMKEVWDVPFFLGGFHAVTVPEDLEKSNFDGFCVGEGELQIVELVNLMQQRKDYSDVASFHFKIPDGIKKNPLGKTIINLDELPDFDWKLFDTQRLIDMRNGWISMQFSRGCVYNCTYCSVTAAKKLLYPKKLKDYLRTYTPERAVRMIENVKEKYNFTKINFDDELLPAYSDWMFKFCKLYKERVGVPYIINSRANIMTEPLVKAMAESGCDEIRIGFETGDYKLRKDILDKDITDEQIINTFDLCRKYGIKASAFAMMGVPGETEETIKKTFRLIGRCKPHVIRLTFLFPFEHTPIYDYCVKNNLFKYPPGYHYKHFDYFTESPLRFEMSERDLTRFKVLFPWFVNAWVYNLVEYYALLQKWWTASFKNVEVQKEIYIDDAITSETCRQSHFRFLDKNRYMTYVER